MSKQRVFLTGATGGMGFAGLKEMLKDTDKQNIVILARNSEKNREILAPYRNTAGLEIVWGDLNDYEVVLKCVKDCDLILHIAAFVSPAADYHPKQAMKVNYGSTRNLINAIYALGQQDKTRLPQPKALVPLSPCVTQADRFPSYTRNAATDYMLRTAVAEGKIKIVFGSRASDLEYLRQPTISPLYGDFSGLPPVFLSASDTEVLLDDSKALYEKLKKQGHQTALDIRHGVCHAFQVFTAMPEAKQAFAVVFRTLEEWI